MRTLFLFLVAFTSIHIGCAQQKTIVMSTTNYTTFRTTQKSFKSAQGTLKYIDRGEGTPILLLHGVPSSSWLYRKMIDDLVRQGHRVIAPDMLGFGSSDNPEGYDIYSAESHAERILALMDSLQIPSWTHIMHDAGGIWTWEMIKKSPLKVDRLVILNTVIYEAGFNPPVRMRPGAFAKFSMWLYRNGVTRGMMMNMLFKKTIKAKKLNKSDKEGYIVPLKEKKTQGMYYFFTQTKQPLPVYDSILKSLDIPVCVIWGKQDDMLQWEPQSDSVSRDLSIKEKNIHLIDAKHFIQEEAHQQIDSIVVEFIQQN